MEIGPGSPRPALTRVTVWVTAPMCKGEQGFGGFLGLRERSSSYINAQGGGLPLASRVFFFDREWQITFTISFSFAEVQTWGESLEMLTIVQQTDARGMRFIWGLNQTVKYLQITL